MFPRQRNQCNILSPCLGEFKLQGDQLYMALCFWYFVKSDFYRVHYSTLAYTGQITSYKLPETHGNVYSGLVVQNMFNVHIPSIYGCIHSTYNSHAGSWSEVEHPTTRRETSYNFCDESGHFHFKLTFKSSDNVG